MWPLLSPSSSGDLRITKRLTCALHYHGISRVLKLQDGNVIRVFVSSLWLFAFAQFSHLRSAWSGRSGSSSISSGTLLEDEDNNRLDGRADRGREVRDKVILQG